MSNENEISFSEEDEIVNPYLPFTIYGPSSSAGVVTSASLAATGDFSVNRPSTSNSSGTSLAATTKSKLSLKFKREMVLDTIKPSRPIIYDLHPESDDFDLDDMLILYPDEPVLTKKSFWY